MASVRPATIRWEGGVEGWLEIVDQRKLPGEVEILRLNSLEEVGEAIRTLAVRGAPAIGVAAGYAMYLAARSVAASSQAAVLLEVLRERGEWLKGVRITAVNLGWAVEEMLRVAVSERGIGVRQLQVRLLQEAHAILKDDVERCLNIGRNGADLIHEGMGVLTHCNAGALAASDYGTALALFYEAQRRGVKFQVFADETRPLLQGARLTAWELAASGVDVTVICDSMAGLVMQQKKVQLVVVGADRIARNGDVANKVGTYSVAQLARAHGVPFVVAPLNTFDLSLASGELIPIEERKGEEISEGFGKRTVPLGVKVYNPAFDVTPGELVTAIVTERGVISPVNEGTVRGMVDR